MSGIQMVVMGGGGVLPNQGFIANLINTSTVSGIRTSALTLNADGSANVTGTGASTTAWLTPYTTGIGANYWVKVTVTASTSSSTTGTTGWLSLASGTTWSASNSGNTLEGTGTATVQFAADSGGATIVATGSLSWDVGYIS